MEQALEWTPVLSPRSEGTADPPAAHFDAAEDAPRVALEAEHVPRLAAEAEVEGTDVRPLPPPLPTPTPSPPLCLL